MKRKDILKILFCNLMIFSLTTNTFVKAEETAINNTVASTETVDEGDTSLDNSSTTEDNSSTTEDNTSTIDESSANESTATNSEVDNNPEENNSAETEEEFKYTATYIYEDFENLPKIVQDTLPEKYKSNTGFGWFFQPPRLKDVVDKENKKLWEPSLFKQQEPRGGNHRVYKATWTSTDMVEITFNVTEPQDLPDDLKGRTFENVLAVSGRQVNVPATEEVKKDDTVWTLSFPETVAGDSDSTVTGVWTSRPVSYSGEVTFVTNNGNQVVTFENENERIDKTDADGDKANEGDSGGGYNKAYFIAWSTVPNYNGRQKDAKLFYGHEAISRAFPNGLKGGEKLYAYYLSISSAATFANNFSGEIEINKNTASLETMDNNFEMKVQNDKEMEFYVKDNVEELSVVNLNANYSLNPYVTTAVRRSSYYHHPGNLDFGADESDDFILNPLNMNNLKERINDLESKYTYVDLHVKLDPRLTVADTISFDFVSYAFRPIVVLKGDYSGVLNSNISKDNSNPNSTITLTTAGEKEFILRTRIRPKGYIPNATLEEAITDMKLVSNNKNNFKLSKEEILKIAREESEKIVIGGHIQGGANLYGRSVPILGYIGGPTDIPKQTAKSLGIDFKPVIVQFDKNSNSIEENTEQNLGKVRVAKDSSIENDIFDRTEKPVFIRTAESVNETIGETMPDNLTEKIVKDGLTYTFVGWATTPNATEPNFTAETVVEEDMTVYAVWKHEPLVMNIAPKLVAENRTIFVGDELNLKDLITEVTDKEEKAKGVDLTKDNVNIVSDGGFNNNVAGEYIITFEVTDSNGAKTTAKAIVTVVENSAPELEVDGTTIFVGEAIDFKGLIKKVYDKEDTDKGTPLTPDNVKIIPGDFNENKVGEYEIIFEVTDSNGAKTTAKSIVTVVENTAPELEVDGITIFVGESIDFKGLIKKVYDKEDTDKGTPLTPDNVKIIPGDFNENKVGEYVITFEVTDSMGKKIKKTITVTVKEKSAEETGVPNKPEQPTPIIPENKPEQPTPIVPENKPEQPTTEPTEKPVVIVSEKEVKKELARTGVASTSILTLVTSLLGAVVLKKNKKED